MNGLLGNAAYYMQRQQPGGLLPAGPASFQGTGGGRMLSAPAGVQQMGPSGWGDAMASLAKGISGAVDAYAAKQEAEKTKAQWTKLFTPTQTQGGPTVQNAMTAPIFSMVPGMTPEKAQFLQMVGPEKGMPWIQAQVLKAKPEDEIVEVNGQLVNKSTGERIGDYRTVEKKPPIEIDGILVDPETYKPLANFRRPEKPQLGSELIQAYDRAVSQGYTGTIEQFDLNRKRAGAQGGGLPAPDPGYMWSTDANGLHRQIPKPGGKVEAEQAAASVKSEKAQQAAKERAVNVVSNIDRALTSLESYPWMKSGFIGSLTSGIGGMPAADLDNLLKPIRAALAFGELQKMREASPTGGALGSIAVAELDLLQNSLYSLEQSQSSDQLIENLKKVKTSFERYTKALEGNVSAFGIKYPNGKSIDAAFATPEGQAELKSFIKDMTKEEILALPPSVQAALNANIQRGQK